MFLRSPGIRQNPDTLTPPSTPNLTVPPPITAPSVRELPFQLQSPPPLYPLTGYPSCLVNPTPPTYSLPLFYPNYSVSIPLLTTSSTFLINFIIVLILFIVLLIDSGWTIFYPPSTCSRLVGSWRRPLRHSSSIVPCPDSSQVASSNTRTTLEAPPRYKRTTSTPAPSVNTFIEL